MPAEVLARTTGLSRQEWLQLRTQGIGGSDAAAIAGLNPWKSPMGVYLEKVGEIRGDDEQSEAAYWGTALEEVVAKEFTRRTGLKVRRRNAILRSAEHPFMIANVDRLVVGDQAPLECKTTGARNSTDWEDGRVPEHYLVQVQHYLAVTGAPYAYIAVLIGGQRFLHQRIERDDEVINYLVKIERDFWENHVIPRVPPPIDGSQASADLMDMLYPAANVQMREVQLPPDAEALIALYEAAKAEEKAAAERRQEAENKLKAMLGEYERGVVGNRLVRWPVITSTRVDTKKLKAEFPDIYAQVTRTSTYRRFEVK